MAQAADPLQIRLLDDEPRSSASESTLHVRKDRLAVLVLLNLTLGIIATVIAYQYIDEAKLFTFEWTERLHPADDRLNMTGFAKELDMMYNTSRNFSVENLGTIMGFILKRARCQPVMLDASLRWGQEGVSPLCNCLRNYHVAYVKAVKPHGPYVTPEKLQEMSHNITLIRDAVQGKCFNSLRPTQVLFGPSAACLLCMNFFLNSCLNPGGGGARRRDVHQHSLHCPLLERHRLSRQSVHIPL